MTRKALTVLLLLMFACPLSTWAADHATANETIWPTQNDVAQTAGNGKKMLENQWAKPFAVLSPNNYTLSGLTVPGTSGSLSINVAIGDAYIAGRHVSIPGATAVTATASQTNYVFLKLTRDGGNLVTGASFEVNITSTPPADSIAIATLTAGASTITATADKRTLPGRIEALTSGTIWTVPAGIFRIYVEDIGASGGGGGGGGSGVTTGPAGATGGAGGTTTFDTFSSTGGGGGFGGKGALVAGGANGGAFGVGSGAPVSVNGGGRHGGTPGNGCLSSNSSGPGGPGGSGGYAAGYLSVTPDVDITYAIGSAGASGAGGVGTGTNLCTGGAGLSGSAGLIVIHY